MSEHLNDVKDLTPEQEARAIAMAAKMSLSYWGYLSASRVIVQLQDRSAQLEHKIDTCGLQCSATMKSLMAENERLRSALAGVQSCSTCEVCRGAATLALGAPSTTADSP